MMAALMIFFVSCETNAIEPDDSEHTLKAATIHYKDSDGSDFYLCFDNYGKQRRWEGVIQDGDHGIFIFDKINGKYHIWGAKTGWINDIFVHPNAAFAPSIPYFAETYKKIFLYWNMAQGATKTTETIAGQSCDVYRIPVDVTTSVYGVWEDAVMLRISDSSNDLVAVSAKRGCPEQAFTKTLEINWK